MIRHGLAIQCELVAPGRIKHGPGWYLSAANGITEAGPFATESDAQAAARWLSENGYGVNPEPYEPFHSDRGVTVGIRRKPAQHGTVLPPTTD